MCLNPIKITNSSKTINHGRKFVMEVPCGHCAECLENKKKDWYFRSFYEAKSTFDNGGYILFDTLTYDNSHLPHLNDFLEEDYQLPFHDNVSCFSCEDYRLFMVRLRRALQYAGFNPKDNLKYFLTSEYGDDDRYTHRPHYHVLFFVTDPKLDPIELSKMIDKCWQQGRTDGVPYKGVAYVLKKRVFGYAYNCDRVHMQMVCNYVSKYVAKDSAFSKTVLGRLDKIFENNFGKYWKLQEGGKEAYEFFKRQVLQFHRASQGFGEDFLKYNKMADIMKTGMIAMPDKKAIVRHHPLPMYYQRKLFYDLIKGLHGEYKWELNELGKDYKIKRAEHSVDMLTDRFNDWITNMGIFNYYHDTNDKDWYTTILNRFLSLNDGRDLRQFAQYLIYYKGRIKSAAQIDREKNGEYYCDDAVEFLKASFDDESSDTHLKYYGTKADTDLFHNKFVTDKDLGDLHVWREEGVPTEYKRFHTGSLLSRNYFRKDVNVYSQDGESYAFDAGDAMSLREFRGSYVIDDSSDKRFAYYDAMWSLYCETQLEKNDAKQKAYDDRIALGKRLKEQGLYVKNI